MYQRILFLLVLIAACDTSETKSKVSKKGAKEGLVKQYYPGGNIKSEITYKDGQRHGLAKRYYKSGKLHQEINYFNNIKDGEAKTYYQSGKLYQLTPYENGYIQGYRLKYREDGRLMAEVPYHFGEPCQGMIEYLLNGKRKRQYPSIEVLNKDQLQKKNKYTLQFTMSEKMQKVQFYEGTLDENGCMLNELENFYSPRPGLAEISFELPPGSAINRVFNVIAKGKTVLGNPYITQRTLKLMIENPGR
ncbi:MAG: toxin-antitoxin system YwqK family antitoxin [Bacteroidota bacterium]